MKIWIDFNNVFSAVIVLQILIKYLLHASYDSLGHVGAMKLYHFLKQLYYYKGMRRKLYSSNVWGPAINAN